MANYFYNGVELPALPEWDKAKYPYASIYDTTGVAMLAFSDIPFTARYNQYGDYDYIDFPGGRTWTTFVCRDGAWVVNMTDVTMDSNGVGTGHFIWANYNVIGTFNGEVYLAASEPVPVYTGIDYKALAQGLIVGKRIAEMRGQKKSNVDGGATAILGVGNLGTMILGYDGGITLV